LYFNSLNLVELVQDIEKVSEVIHFILLSSNDPCNLRLGSEARQVWNRNLRRSILSSAVFQPRLPSFIHLDIDHSWCKLRISDNS
jgi:hypothetical protein